jgi:putative restriction endonuclease
MAYGVFIHRPDSIYDDVPSLRYHFPASYFGRVERCLGDWIVYLEPTKVSGTRGYFAVARVESVYQDTRADDMYYAVIEPGSYLDFCSPVPFNGDLGIVERGVLRPDGKLSGRPQAAVRVVSSEDFARIVGLGLGEHAVGQDEPDEQLIQGLHESPQAVFDFDLSVMRERALSSRAVRDKNFPRSCS